MKTHKDKRDLTQELKTQGESNKQMNLENPMS